MSMSKLDRAAARERCEKATPGPWSVDPWKEQTATQKADKFTWVNGADGPIFGTAGRALIHNAVFTGNARADLPLALAELIEKDALIASQAARIEFLENEIHAWEESDAANAAGIFPPADDADRSEEAPLTDPRKS